MLYVLPHRGNELLNIFPTNPEDGSLSHLSSRLPKEFSEKLIDMLLTCLAGSGLAIALYDPADHLQFANPAFRDAYAIAPDAYPSWEETMRNCYSTGKGAVIETNNIDGWLADISTRRRNSKDRNFEIDLTDGRWLRINESMSAEGWLLVVASDITRLKVNERQLELARDSAMHAAQTDPLTGGYNRRFIFSRLDEMLKYAQKTGTSLSVAVIDLDHFKNVNDTYGHQAGDRLLQHFVAQAQCNLRHSDLLGRIGGEEFMLLLPETSLSDAMQMVERLRRAIGETIALQEWPEVRCNFSAGLTGAGLTDTVSSLFQRADQAVYGAKQNGRNRQLAIPS